MSCDIGIIQIFTLNILPDVAQPLIELIVCENSYKISTFL